MAAGTEVGAITMTESSTGSDLQSIRTTAIRDGDEFVINGSKTYISNGQHCDVVFVVATTDPSLGAKGTSLIVIEAGTAGFTKGRSLKKPGQAAADLPSFSLKTVGSPRKIYWARKARALYG